MSRICRSRSPTISSSSARASAGSRPRGSSDSVIPDASILLLDNHDDFGGHAKRNEFTVDGRFLLGYGGSEALQSPEALYGPEAKGMLRALGIDYHRFERFFDTDLYPSLGLSRAVFFAEEAFGEDRLVTGDPMRMVADDIPADRMHERSPEAFIADFPVSDEAKAQLLELYTSTRDPYPALSRDRDDRAPVADQLPRVCAEGLGARRRGGRHVPGTVARLLRDRDRRRVGVRRDGNRLPGLRGDDALHAIRAAAAEMDEPYIYHFPDGNASIARAIVRSLIPAVAPGDTMDDIVTARFDYGALDVDRCSHARMRLQATRCTSATMSDGVDVGYVRGGTAAPCARRRARPRRLPHDDPLDHARAAGAPAPGAARQRQGAAVLHEGRRARLASVGAPGRARDHEPDGLLLPAEARLPREHRRLPVSPNAGRADGAAPRACPDRAEPRPAAPPTPAGRRGSCCTTHRSRISSSTCATS